MSKSLVNHVDISTSQNSATNISAADVNGEINNVQKLLTSLMESNTKIISKCDSWLTPEIYGAKGDGITDDTAAIQKSIDSLSYGGTLLFHNNSSYLISSPLVAPCGVNLIGNKCFLFYSSNYTEQTTDETIKKTYILRYGEATLKADHDAFSIKPGIISGFIISNYLDNKTLNGIYVADNCLIDDIYTWGLNRTICCSGSYIDFIEINNINIWGKHGSDYAIDTGYIGDGRRITKSHMHVGTCKNINHLKIGNGHNCIHIYGIVNGNILVGSSVCALDDIHIESGILSIYNSTISVQSGFFWKNPQISPIVINGPQSIVSLKDITVNYYADKDYSTDTTDDISLVNAEATLNIKNVFKNMLPKCSIGSRNYAGITISGQSRFNANNSTYSLESVLRNSIPYSCIKNTTRSGKYSNYNVIGALYSDSGFKWKLENGTYYYKVVMLFDPDRMAGNSWATKEEAKACSKDGAHTLIALNGSFNSNIRVYRGTFAGIYDHYVDVGLINGYLMDDGIMCNGNKWIERTAGAGDKLFECTNYYTVGSSTVEVSSNTVPTIGKWMTGDVVVNTTPTPGGTFKWVCTDGNKNTWANIKIS